MDLVESTAQNAAVPDRAYLLKQSSHLLIFLVSISLVLRPFLHDVLLK